MRVEGRATPAIPTVLEPEWKTAANGGTWRNGTGRMRVSERLPHVARSLRDRECGWKDEGPRYSDSLRTGMENRGERWDLEGWNAQNASLGETRPRGSVSPRPKKRMEGRRAPAIPTVFESEWEIVAHGGTWRDGTVGMQISPETRPRGYSFPITIRTSLTSSPGLVSIPDFRTSLPSTRIFTTFCLSFAGEK